VESRGMRSGATIAGKCGDTEREQASLSALPLVKR